MRSSYLLAVAVLAVSPSTSIAQKSNTQGFMGNIHFNGVSVTPPKQDGEKSETGSGGGVGFRAGWGFSHNFTIFAGVDVAKVEFDDTDGDFGMVHLDFAVIYNFANPDRKLIPYLEIGGSARAFGATLKDPGSGAEADFAQGGGGWMAGAGVNYFFTRSTALNVGLNIGGGKFEDMEIDDTTIADTGGDAGSARFNVGLTFYPMKK
jgi:hypothetical protein